MEATLFAKCSCSRCGNHIQFPIDGAGAVIACPHCNEQTQLTLEAPPAPADKPTATEIIAAFGGPVPRTRVSLFYQLGLMLVTVTMLILPLLYLAMVGVAIWGVYLYASHFSFLLTSGTGGPRIWFVKLVMYLGPLFIGFVVVFFMIKPLFARSGVRSQPLALNPGVESTLYAFISIICDTVDA